MVLCILRNEERGIPVTLQLSVLDSAPEALRIQKELRGYSERARKPPLSKRGMNGRSLSGAWDGKTVPLFPGPKRRLEQSQQELASVRTERESSVKISSCLERRAFMTPHGLIASQEFSDKTGATRLCTVPWGTGKQAILRYCERLGKVDLYGSVSSGREVSPLVEPRTPCIRCRRVSVPLRVVAVEAIQRYLTEARPRLVRRESEQALFLNHHGEHLTRQGFWLIIKGYAREVGITAITPHMLRHSFAILMLNEGMELRSVQESLGHAHISTTQVYSQLVCAQQPDR
jgi:hypothetical protein